MFIFFSEADSETLFFNILQIAIIVNKMSLVVFYVYKLLFNSVV